jgi:hypothetical protein
MNLGIEPRTICSQLFVVACQTFNLGTELFELSALD